MTTTPTASPELLDLNRMSFLTGTIVAAPMLETDIVMHDLRITKAGIVYKGEKVNDAGAVHAALMNVLVRGGPLPPRAQPEGEAPQAVARLLQAAKVYAFNYMQDEADSEDDCVCGPKQHAEAKEVFAAIRAVESLPAATLSPLCGAQHAESGKEAAALPSGWAVEHVGDAMHIKRADGMWCGYMVNNGPAAALTFEFLRDFAAQQVAAPGALDDLDFTPDAHHQVADMANVGYELMQTIKALRPDYCWNDTPAEIVSDLINELDEATASAPGTPEAPQTAAARDVLAERQRQVEAEGWTLAHDDGYVDGQLASAAVAYAQAYTPYLVPSSWPWAVEWFKAADDRRNLVKAGALVLAEIERLDRAAAPKGGA